DDLLVVNISASAAGTVAEMFTTRRSSLRRNEGRSVNRACTMRSELREETSSRTASRVSPRASGGSCASSFGGRVKSIVVVLAGDMRLSRWRRRQSGSRIPDPGSWIQHRVPPFPRSRDLERLKPTEGHGLLFHQMHKCRRGHVRTGQM